LADKQKNEPRIWFIVLVVITAILASDIAKRHLQGGPAVGVGACAIGLVAAGRARWDLKAKWWFWCAICVGAAFQLPLIFLSPWAAPQLTGSGAMLFVIPGFLMALGSIFLAEKVFSKQSSPK
jgi:peptidoglycan/LPS O-acetylase OafA/YrhL